MSAHVTHAEDNEWSAVASREGRDGFENTVLSSRSFPAKTIGGCHRQRERKIDLRGVTSQEVIASLLGKQLANRWEDTESIAGEHDDVLRLTLNGARNAGVGNKLDGVCATGVLGDTDVVVVGLSRNDVIDNVLENGTEADGIVNLGLLLGGKVNALGVASTLDVKNTVVRPDVLIITNQLTVGVGG